MEREELFRAIERVCHFKDVSSLLDRIHEVLGLREKSDGCGRAEHRIREVPGLREKSDEHDRAEQKNVFYIENSGEAINTRTYEEVEEYRKKIMNVGNLKAVRDKHKDEKDSSGAWKQLDKMIDEIKKKPPGGYEKDENCSEKLAMYIKKTILDKYVKKISTICYKQVYDGNQQDHFYYDLVEEISEYLKSLGVYTIVAETGKPYSDVLDWYESIYDASQGSSANPIIKKVEYPAYIIEYVEEDGDSSYYCLQGKCILERG